ncbi:MAG: hypothetical protein ABIR30_12250 [Chitinophagaceae bacterium]
MTTKTLHRKTNRYLSGAAMPAEARQIETWLSCTEQHKSVVPETEKEKIEQEILEEVRAFTAYPLFFPKAEPWWKKFTAIF